MACLTLPSSAMTRSHHRLPFALRVFVLGLLALGMVLMPVLASLGELHELAHGPSGAHAMAVHGQSHGHSAGMQDELAQAEGSGEEDGSDPLHALIHFAHCCGQQSLTAPSLMPLLAPSAATTALLMPVAQVLPSALALAPFRPPITG